MTVRASKPSLNLREALSELNKPSGVAGEAMLRAETPQEQFNLIGAGRKNILVNGDFQVSQRGDYSSATVTADGTYRLDRWYLGTNNNNSTVQRTTVAVSDSPESQYAQKCVAGSTATSYLGIRQKVENPARYAGKTVTYSGWVRSNHTGARLTMYVTSPATIVTSNTHSGNGSWEKLSVTVKLPDAMSGTWYVDVHISSASVGNTSITASDYFEAADLQLELGSVATPFEHRSYGEELALCQRYFCKSYSDDTYPPTNTANGCEVLYSDGTTSYHGGYRFPVSMRVQPSISLWTKNGNANQAQLNFTSGSYVDISVYAPSHKSFNVYQSTAGTVGIYAFHYTADAEL